jgi:hypothetical protein
LHTDSQHTPSVQNPLPHSALLAQLEPAPFTQLPAAVPAVVSAQYEPAPQELAEQHTETPGALLGTQFPLMHWVGSVHVVPRPPVVTHIPALQA